MLKTAMIFGNGMVLQRKKQIAVWGTADAGAWITVTLGHERSSCLAQEDGTWMVYLPEREAARNLRMSITDGKEMIRYSDISVGEVWIAGGQSNMEFPLAFDEEFDPDMEVNEEIRFFNYPEVSYEERLQECDFREYGHWRKASAKAAPYFTAVGYYFAKKLREKGNMPIGIVECTWGGTPACAWMNPGYLQNTQANIWKEEYENDLGKLDIKEYKKAFKENPFNDRTKMVIDSWYVRMMKTGLTREEQIEFMDNQENSFQDKVMGPYDERRPGGLYEVMLKKIAPYSARGVLWYQGESDDRHPQLYATVFRKLIENWRELWQEELPFLFVQLAPFEAWMGERGTAYPILRQQQEIVSKTVPETWMISSSDCGARFDIHPKNKRLIGERLALAARGHVYGDDLICDAPEIQNVFITGEDLVLIFRHGDGLCVDGDSIQDLVVMDKEGNTIQVSDFCCEYNVVILRGCKDADKVSLAVKDYYQVNLYNEAGIPAKPFEQWI